MSEIDEVALMSGFEGEVGAAERIDCKLIGRCGHAALKTVLESEAWLLDQFPREPRQKCREGISGDETNELTLLGKVSSHREEDDVVVQVQAI